MHIKIRVTHAHIAAVAALVLGKSTTTVLAAKFTATIADFAYVYVMETRAAVITEMLIIFIVHYAKPLAAIGIALAAVKAKSAKVTDLNGTESASAIGTEMLVPFGVFYTVFAALTALGVGVIHTAEYTKSAIVAKLDAVLVQALLALLANDTTLLTMEIAVLTDFIGAVAVAAFLAVHQLQLRAAHAEAAAVAQTALHTVAAEPADTAQFIF